MSLELLATKLHRPALPPTWVRRAELTARLNEGPALGRRVTLVSAPAGFGKTMCVSAWLESLDGPAIAWLSLDEGDDDPARFFLYLVAALQTALPNFGHDLEGILRGGQIPPADAIAASLINELRTVHTSVLLVLDDLHVLQDPTILATLGQLVTYGPGTLHAVLVTREDPPLPLARLRANGQLTEIRAQDLRFTVDDAARFLEEALGESVEPGDVVALEAKTEGWIAGLQLAAIAMRTWARRRGGLPASGAPIGEAAFADFVAELGGSHRYILAYLTEEVLDHQPPEVRDFMLHTAILNRMTSDLCDAVTGGANGRAMLAHLRRANLFLIPLDDQGRWYRYHHLFADLLRGLYVAEARDEAAAGHRRAARWYELAAGRIAAQDGERSLFVGEAMHHRLAAADYDAAVALLERHAMDLVMQGHVKTVGGWVAAIPGAWDEAQPKTHLALAWMHLLRGAYAEAAPHLNRAHRAIDAAAPRAEGARDAVLAEWLVMQSLLRYMEGRPSEGRALAERALEAVPEDDRRVSGLAHYALASARLKLGDRDGARAAYRVALEESRAAQNLVAEMLSTVGLGTVALEVGRLHEAYEIATVTLARSARSGTLPPILAVIHGLVAEVAIHLCRIDEARHHAQRAIQLSSLGGYETARLGCHVILSRVAQLGGDLDGAAEALGEAATLLQVPAADDIRDELVAQQVRLCLAQGDPDGAARALAGRGAEVEPYPVDLAWSDGLSYAQGLLINSAVQLRLHRARSGDGDPAAVMRLVDRVIGAAEAAELRAIVIEGLLLRAQIHGLGRTGPDGHDVSREDWARAVALAHPEGYRDVFVGQGQAVALALRGLLNDDLTRDVDRAAVTGILDAFDQVGGATSVVSVALVEPLSDRETEVLRLVAEGLTYREIGDRLFISLNTVRSHIKALYGKLGVNNRTQAVTKAQALALI